MQKLTFLLLSGTGAKLNVVDTHFNNKMIPRKKPTFMDFTDIVDN